MTWCLHSFKETNNSFIFLWRGFSEVTTIDKITKLKTCSSVEKQRQQVNPISLGEWVSVFLWFLILRKYSVLGESVQCTHSVECFCQWCRDHAQLQILDFLGVALLPTLDSLDTSRWLLFSNWYDKCQNNRHHSLCLCLVWCFFISANGTTHGLCISFRYLNVWVRLFVYKWS